MSSGTIPPCRAVTMVAVSCSRSARRGYPSLPHCLIASPAGSAARAAGVGHRASQLRYAGTTRATGVCCSMISLTSTDQGVVPGPRHGRSRAWRENQASIGSV